MSKTRHYILDKYQRNMVESIKDAKTMKLTWSTGDGDEIALLFDMRRFNIRYLVHCIALAVQDYFQYANRTLSR